MLLKVKSENHIDFWFFFNTISLLNIQNHCVSTFCFSPLEYLRAVSKQSLDCKSEGEKCLGPSSRSSKQSLFAGHLVFSVPGGEWRIETSRSSIITQIGRINLTHSKHKLFQRSFSKEKLLINGIFQEITSVEIFIMLFTCLPSVN